MCNCSNFVGDDDNGMELEGSHHINADGAFSRETDFNEGGAGSFGFTYDAADGAYSGADMTLEDDAFDYAGGISNRRGNASHSSGDGGSWVNEMSDFDGEVENGDEFDNFLTKRMRGRRKLRKTLRKEGGLTKKEARKQALSTIPKQSLIKTTMNAIKGKTSPETQALIDQGLLSPNKNVMAGQISEAVAENEAEGTQAGTDIIGSLTDAIGLGGGDTQTQAPAAAPDTKKGGMGTMMWVGIGAVVLIGGYFAFGKKLGIR
jgi:hypothetical protein